MKMKANLKIISCCCLLWASGYSAFAQDFINLDFEDAVIVPDPSSPFYPSAINASDALPGWTAPSSVGPNDVLYNTVTLGSPTVAILGTGGFPPALDGNFSIYLYGRAGYSTGASISQTGLVPVNTSSILFIAQSTIPSSGGGPLLVSLGGQSISYSAISTGPNYTTYAGNIPPGLAGKSEQLTISASSGVNNFWEVDDIEFSTAPVPEPNSFGLFALGGLFVAWRHWRGSVR